ncbi:cleavage stimulation factor subunit 2-like [Centruroides vittatus]|uniref:cleavage stimulation factor subunit 2-like n=1 Tax=Centruroides vittatus TaxID=120091 RepID=UPI00350FC579
MAAIQGALSAAERSMRSVFVGNIPYEATEEQLKDIFCEVGPVVSFRLVYDRETGKPKGYGFCEYKDQDTALSAMRNLNGYEFNGRALRVDNAASEKNKEELKNLQASLGGPPAESPYGTEVESNEAPESISKAVASLPPEQMFELMKQMKMCIQNNPNEARNMLLQNPQLAYALLQAQVIMRIIDPQVALSILYRQNVNPPSVLPQSNGETQQPVPRETSGTQALLVGQSGVCSAPPLVSAVVSAPQSYGSPLPGPGTQPQMTIGGNKPPFSALRTSLLGDRPPLGVRAEGPRMGVVPPFPENRAPEPFDPRLARSLGDRDMRQNLGDRDMRQLPLGDRDMRQIMADQDLRTLPPVQGVAESHVPFDPRFRNVPPDRGGSGGAPFDPRLGARAAAFEQRGAFDAPRGMNPSQVRFDVQRPSHPLAPNIPGMGMATRPLTALRGAMPVTTVPTSGIPPIQSVGPRMSAPAPVSAPAQPPVTTPDQEKAALIMQVLQLSDQQISMLPPEQRQSIMILKEQIARSAQP